ncbi:hypothetical protein N7520_004291 [Penicillium odoratum]|uniref:uncharacterized protein n=1 Tax=Penicillium odoratum TaxID=1167516 RepID=UPI002548B00A|nr:uncharacterized protein N7520_004291 [Penicillium odoratum]KAJ5764732.1 hypothetical protein N7520_004291 [Penicillium odoratum]
MQQLYVDLAPCLAKDECYPCVIFPSDARLSCVKSSIYQLLYSSSSVYKSDVQLLVDVRKLDDDLEAWRQAIPHKYRPGHSAQDPKDGNNGERDARVLLIRLEYEFCLALIHKATSRCVVGTTSEIEKLPGLSSSHALAVQATITTIFCNILQNPHDVSVEWDLALLQAIPALTYAFQPRHLTSEAAHHARQLNDYAYELSRIAQCAVRKAKKNDIS